MLAEKRLDEIVRYVDAKKSVTVQELMGLLDSSESTVRRDLAVLHEQGRVVRVHGGAIAITSGYASRDVCVDERNEVNTEDKMTIAKYAASLIEDNDFVFIDAGTTTEYMIDFIGDKNVRFVTNGIEHGKKLSRLGYITYILGGELKKSTEAVVGEEAVATLSKYNFTKGFFGANGISKDTGFSTPDSREAMVKKTAAARCKEVYVLADVSKFSQIAPVSFLQYDEAEIITTNLGDKEKKYKKEKNIMEVKKI